MSSGLPVAILGATGLVGRELVSLLEERDFPIEKLVLLASPNSEGAKIEFRGQEIAVREAKAEHLAGTRIAFLATGSKVSAQWAPMAAQAGAMVIDTSSAFRMDDDVPLVVPEVNPDAAALCKSRRIVASPNSSTIPLAVALKPLHDAARIQRVVVSTYQAVSGKGQRGMEELEKQIADLMNGRETEAAALPHRIAFNVVPQIDSFVESGYTRQETKIADEARKILADPALRISATAVHVPVFFGHAEAVNLTTERKLTAAEARELLKKAPGLKVLDDPKAGIYPMPMLATGDDFTQVGRIREDMSQPNGLELFLCADNLRKGAALNAVQIAELLLQRGLVA
jgi:aspartate-semialdehyde dehydrogenase